MVRRDGRLPAAQPRSSPPSHVVFGGGPATGPQSFILSYDKISNDGTIDIMIRWDHRIADAALIGVELSRLEQVLNHQVADEMLALAATECGEAAPALAERIGSTRGISREVTPTS